jgi:hypothetical protein
MTVKEYKGSVKKGISWYERFGLLITILVGTKIRHTGHRLSPDGLLASTTSSTNTLLPNMLTAHFLLL